MKIDAVKKAESIIGFAKMKKKFVSVMENYEDEVQDMILIFVTPDWEADAFWSELSEFDVLRVLRAVGKGIRIRSEGRDKR